MTTEEQHPDSASGDSSDPRAGDFQFGDDGQIKVFDGKRWKPYGKLPDGGAGSILQMRAARPGDDGETE